MPLIEHLNILYCGLPPSLANSISDLISDSSPDSTYESVKAEILGRKSASAQISFRHLLENEDIGDRTPTQFPRHLRELSGGSNNDEELLRMLLLFRLPPTVTAILAPSLDSSGLNQVATMGDKIMEIALSGTFSPV